MICSSLKRLFFNASVLSNNLRENSNFNWGRMLGAGNPLAKFRFEQSLTWKWVLSGSSNNHLVSGALHLKFLDELQIQLNAESELLIF